MNDVSIFFYYMWNNWCEAECEKAFTHANCEWQHFWNKWCNICDTHSVFGAAEMWYAELSESNRDLIVNRAKEVYREKGF